MKIVFFIDQVYRHGGIERVLSVKANYLSKFKEYDIYVVTSEQLDKKPCYSFHQNIIFKDLNINYDRKKSYFHIKNLLKLPKHINKIHNTLSKIKPDIAVVCSHSADTYFIPFILKKIPKIKEFHFSKSIEDVYRRNSGNFKKKYFLKFTDYVETKYDKLVILNQNETIYYKSKNTKTIPNPLTFFPDNVSDLSNNVIISAGRIAPVKRFDLLIDIWKLVCDKNKDWKLHIYGPSEKHYFDYLQNKIDKHELSEYVYLKGATKDIKSKMLQSSLFVMTSENECFPLVLLEAQACGLPIVSFDCPHGPRNIITEKSGLLIKMDDTEAFSKAILNLISAKNTLKEYGVNARKNSLNYRIEKVMELWLSMFDELKQKNK